LQILASEAGNLALKFLVTGGVHLAGGVAVHTLRLFEEPAFLQHFKRKGRFTELMGRILIDVVVTPAGLMGAAAYGLEGSIPDSELP
jgi:glucokinase